MADGMAERTFQHRHRVSYAECTLGDHVYYSRYLDLLEEARGELFRFLGAPFLRWQREDTIFPVIESRVRYLAPARYDDLLTIEVWLTALERVRINFGYRVLLEAQQRVILEASTWHVCTGMDEKPKRLPPELSELLQPYLAATPHKN